MARPGDAFYYLGVLSRARALGLVPCGVHGTISKCLQEVGLWQDQQTPVLTQLGPIMGALIAESPSGPVTASLWNHLILHMLLLPDSGDPSIQTLVPVRGSLLILGWLALALWASFIWFLGPS